VPFNCLYKKQAAKGSKVLIADGLKKPWTEAFNDLFIGFIFEIVFWGGSRNAFIIHQIGENLQFNIKYKGDRNMVPST
jgi:hypothetical protein